MTLGVREACREVMRQAEHVAIVQPALERLSERIGRGDLPHAAPVWNQDLHWVGAADRTANYVLALDALNYCFWAYADQTRWRIRYRDATLDGYWALAASLKRAIERGLDLTDARVMAGMDRDTLAEVLAGEGEIPLLETRAAHLKEAGQWLLERHDGQTTRFVSSCEGSAVRLAFQVARELGSFDDRATYHGREIPFFKRAQILAVDLASCFAGHDLGGFEDLGELTAFADYKVPQVLREHGVLAYAPDLAAAIEARVEIPPGSPEEVEIRAATVVAVEGIARWLGERGIATSEVALDGMLWNLGQGMTFVHPYHRTRTIYY